METRPLKIPFNKPFIVGKELYYIAQAVLRGHLSGDGEYTNLCHKYLEEKLGCSRAFLTHSCTGALEMAAILCEIEQGDEIIMPSFTFVSTANAFVLHGGVPVFVDIKPDTLNIDERLIEAAISPRTKVIVPVHYAGVACAMDEIMDIARHRSLLVVEDAAQGLLATYKNRNLGTIGHLGCLSFHETKNIISGEGGALLINEERFVGRAEIIREKGTNRSQFFRGEVDKYSWIDIGSSFLPSELVGAFLYAQLEEAEKINTKRNTLFNLYLEGLAPLQKEEIIQLPYIDDFCKNNAHIFYLIARSLNERTELIDHLKGRGVHSVFHYVPLHSSPAGRRYGRVAGDMKVTDDLSGRLLRLPIYYSMEPDDVHMVVDAIKSFYSG